VTIPTQLVLLAPLPAVLISLVVISRFERYERRILQTLVIPLVIWMCGIIGFIFIVGMGDSIDSVEVRNDSSHEIRVSGGVGPLAPAETARVIAVNGVEDVGVAIPDGRVVTYTFSERIYGESNLLVIENAQPPTGR
jgi:hypothetical protein